MQHFFVDHLIKEAGAAVTSWEAVLQGKEAHHICNVLRMQVGEAVSIACAGQIYNGTLSAVSKQEVRVTNLQLSSEPHELPVALTVLQGLPKGDKLELIIQKVSELGAKTLIPLACARSIAKAKSDKLDKQTARRREIALAAAKQAKRAAVMQVEEVLTLANFAKQADYDYLLVAYEEAPTVNSLALWWRKQLGTVRQALAAGKELKIAVAVGPEGGFTAEEVAQFQALGADIVSLGARILRTETAALAMLSYLMLELEAEKNL